MVWSLWRMPIEGAKSQICEHVQTTAWHCHKPRHVFVQDYLVHGSNDQMTFKRYKDPNDREVSWNPALGENWKNKWILETFPCFNPPELLTKERKTKSTVGNFSAFERWPNWKQNKIKQRLELKPSKWFESLKGFISLNILPYIIMLGFLYHMLCFLFGANGPIFFGFHFWE